MLMRAMIYIPKYLLQYYPTLLRRCIFDFSPYFNIVQIFSKANKNVTTYRTLGNYSFI